MIKAWCCWGTDYCKCGCLGLTRNQNVKLTYIIIIIISYIAITVITTLTNHQMPEDEQVLTRMKCANVYPEGSQSMCYWQQSLFRVSLVIGIMHFLLFFLMLLRNETSKISNEGAWFLKLVFIILLSFFCIRILPSSITHSIHEITQYLAIFWYIVQNLIVIDFIYGVDAIINGYAELFQKLHIIKAILSILFLGVAIYLNVITYLEIQEGASHFVPIVNSIIILTGFLVVFLRIFKGNTLMVFGLITLYANLQAYLLSIHSHNKERVYTSGTEALFQNFLILFCLMMILGAGSNKIRTKKSTLNEILALNTSREEEDIRYVSSNKWIIFHYIFFVICLILPTIIMKNTGFSAQSMERYEEKEDMFDMFRLIDWIAILGVYLWALVSSRLYPEQDFSEMQKYFKEYQLN